jgi:hypothetical protein
MGVPNLNRDAEIDRYLRIVRFATNRYTQNGEVVTHIGGKPAVFQRIIDAAWDRYITKTQERIKS